MINRRTFLSFTPVGLLGACTTVPENQAMTLQPVAAGKANIYVYRKGGFFDQFKTCEIELNQQPQGLLFDASYLVLQVPAGKHMVAAKSGFMIGTAVREISVEAGKTYFLEVVYSYAVAGPFTVTNIHVFPAQQDKAMQGLNGARNALELAKKN